MSQIKIVIVVLGCVVHFLLCAFSGPRDHFTVCPERYGARYPVLDQAPAASGCDADGMALGASGAVLQGILRNPLADPYILGISSGASLCAASVSLAVDFLGEFYRAGARFCRRRGDGGIVGMLGWKTRWAVAGAASACRGGVELSLLRAPDADDEHFNG